MSNLSKFLLMVAINAGLGLMYYLWQIKGINQAGNVFIFWVWLIGITGTLMIFGTPKAKDYKPNPLWLALLNRMASIAIVIGTVWAGHTVAATFYAIGCLITYGYTARQKELAGAEL